MWLNFSDNVYVNENYMKTVSYLDFLVLFQKLEIWGRLSMRHFNQRTKLFRWKVTVAMAPIDLKEAIFH